MKLVKGIVIGSVIAAGVMMMYNDGMLDKKRALKRGRQLAKRMGAI